MGLAVSFNLPPGDPQQGPQHLAPPGWDAQQPRQGGPPAQVHQHRFGVVVGVVGGEDSVLLPRRQALEKAVPHLAAALLQAQAPPAGQGGHVLPAEGKIQPKALGKGPGRGLVPVRFLPPQLVVHVGQHQALRAQAAQQPVGQGGGIRPAGKAHHHLAPLGQAGDVRPGQELTHGG